MRSEMYGLLRDWLKGGMLLYDKDLLEGLAASNYTHRSVNGVDCILLEKKEDIKNRLPTVSLDEADALAISFAYPVQKTDHTQIIAKGRKYGLEAEYQPYGAAWKLPETQTNDQRRSWLPGQQSPFPRY